MELQTVDKNEVYGATSITNANMCKKSRAFTFDVRNPDKSSVLQRATIIKNTVINALKYNVRDREDIRGYMLPQYPSCEYPNFQVERNIFALDLNVVMRYLRNEPRSDVFFPRARIKELDGKKYRASCDAAFPSERMEGRRKVKCLELVTFKARKPEYTATGNKNALVRDLRLYLMVLLGRDLGYEEITASYYYLRKDGDSANWSRSPQSFFSNNNVIRMRDVYHGHPNQLDEDMKPSLKTLRDGIDEDDQCQEDCQYCDKFDLCKYTAPPIVIQKEPEAKKAGAIRLTDEQKKAVENMTGIMRINATAGAGKTMVVAMKIKYLIEHGVEPEEIFCGTFTKAGAQEMMHRAETYTGKDLTGMVVSTFNSFEYDIVKDCFKLLGFTREPKVVSDPERFRFISDLLAANPIYAWNGASFLNFSVAKGAYNQMKGALRIVADCFSEIKKRGGDISTISPRDLAGCTTNDMTDGIVQEIIDLYPKYADKMKEKSLIDLDDQELLAFKVFELDPGYMARKYKFKHILIDEFQDSSQGNIDMINVLKGLPTFRSLSVIGDDFQAIFGFRRTSPEYMINLEKYVQGPVKDVTLNLNHRSTPQICEFANAVIDFNRDKLDKKLVASRPDGVPVVVNGFMKATDEIRYIADGIERHIKAGTKPEDIAVITYTKGELQKIVDELTKRRIPSMFGAPQPKMENSRIRAILAFARVLRDRSNSRDALIAANAVVHGEIMEECDDDVRANVAAVMARAKAIDEAETLQEKKAIFMGYVEAVTDGDEMVEDFANGISGKDFDEILNYCADFEQFGGSEEFRRINESPGVVLITAHSSKGLEYPIVYNSITKYARSDLKSRGAIEEMRRLFFVSATRARDELYVTGLFANGVKGAKYKNIFVENAYSAAGRTYAFDLDE